MNSRSRLKLEALEQRQLLAGIVGNQGGQEVLSNVVHPNGNVYDQVLMNGSTVTVSADAGQVTRVSFLDLQGDIVQAEFSGAGTLTISLDPETFKGPAEAANYNQPGVKYVQGLASFTIQGSDASTNFGVFSVGTGNAHNKADNPIFAGGKSGGDHTADVARLTIVANPLNPNGSTFGGIRAGNAVFSDDSGTVGIAASNVHIQNVVTLSNINATGSGTPTLIFGDKSQFSEVTVAGGGLLSANGKAINNTGSYLFALNLTAGEKSDGSADAAENTGSQLAFTGNNPIQAQTKVFTLTTGIDTIVGSNGNDSIIATNTTITGLDTIDGGDGVDALTIGDITGNANLALLTVKNVESLALTSVAGLNGGAADISGWTGLTSATIVLQDLNVGGAQAITAGKGTALTISGSHVTNAAQALAVTGGSTVDIGVTSKAGSTVGTITVTGVEGTTSVNVTESGGGTEGAVNVIDVNGASATKAGTITTVSLSGIGGASSIQSNALTTLTLAKNAQVVTIDDDLTAHTTSTTTLALTVNELGAGAGLTDANNTIATLNITTTGKDSALNVQSNTSLKTITVGGDKALNLSGSAIGALTTLTASGTAGVTATIGTGTTFTGAGGKDVISVGATTKALTGGAGDDTFNVNASAITGTIDAGDGTDTLGMSAANAVAATASATFEGKISNFEKLSIGANGAVNPTIDLANLDDISYVVVNGDNTGDLTITNLASGGTLEFAVTQTGGTTITAGVTGALLGTEDVLNVKASGTAAVAMSTVAAADVETVNFLTDDSATTATGIAHTATLTDAAAKKVTVSGDAGLALTFAGTALTSFDASAVTKGSVTYTTAALASAATLTGGAGNDTIIASAATAAVTLNGGGGNDTLTINNAKNNTIDGGAGDDTIVVGNGNNTIVGGAGADTITLGSGANTVTAGDGNDTITIGAASVGLNKIDVGAGTDTVVLAAAPSAAGFYTSVTGMAAGDKINVSGVTTNASTVTPLGAKITLGAAASFANYLDAATNDTDVSGGGGGAAIKWFEYGGNTYVVVDNSNTSTFVDGTDSVIELVGSIDLSKSTVAADVITIV